MTNGPLWQLPESGEGELSKFIDGLWMDAAQNLNLRLYDDSGKDVTDQYPHLHIGSEMAYITTLRRVVVPLVRKLTDNQEWMMGQ